VQQHRSPLQQRKHIKMCEVPNSNACHNQCNSLNV
jgi:hypothetical protein